MVIRFGTLFSQLKRDVVQLTTYILYLQCVRATCTSNAFVLGPHKYTPTSTGNPLYDHTGTTDALFPTYRVNSSSIKGILGVDTSSLVVSVRILLGFVSQRRPVTALGHFSSEKH